MASLAISRPKLNRDLGFVEDEYTGAWNSYRGQLESSASVEEWLADNDDIERYYNINGKFAKQIFNSSEFHRKICWRQSQIIIRQPKASPNSAAELGGISYICIYIIRI